MALVLTGAVLSAVHHAEVEAHRVGEPFGSLVLAVAVTVIEVARIVTLMVSGGPETATLARDTVFAAVMITCNGIVGVSLLLGARRYGLSVFNAEGSGAALTTVATVAALSLVLPTLAPRSPGPPSPPHGGAPVPAARRSPRPRREDGWVIRDVPVGTPSATGPLTHGVGVRPELLRRRES
ncbi:hypothetical protein [Geodermatophilus sp. SYSU D01176]